MPKLIISRLIVSFHEKIIIQNEKVLVWRSGFIISLNNCKAIIRADYEEKISYYKGGEK